MEMNVLTIVQFVVCAYERLCPQNEHSVVSNLFKLTIELFVAAWTIHSGDNLQGYLSLVQGVWSMFDCLIEYLKKEWPN